jgi:hypothetical protein
MIFVSLKKSTRADKKYVIVFSNPDKTIHFGSKNSKTFLDHGDETIRNNYIKRHKVNEVWDKINAGSASRYILWGDSTSLDKNLSDYLKRFNIK